MSSRRTSARSTGRSSGRGYVQRRAPIERLVGATEFTDDPQLQDPVFIVRTLKRFPQLHDPLVADTTRPASTLGGRPRLEGSWALVYVVMTVLGAVDLEKFWARNQSATFWQECGFDRCPAWGTFYERIVELETGDWNIGDAILDPAADRRRIGGLPPSRQPDIVADGTEDQAADELALPQAVGAWRIFERAAAFLIQRARSRDSRVGAHWMTDGTSYHSHARLVHCCPDPDLCRRRRQRRNGSLARVPKIVERAADDLVKDIHHEETAGPEPHPDDAAVGALRQLAPGDEWDELIAADPHHKYVWIGDHLYCTRDTTAGLCMYGGDRGRRRKKVWIGGHELFSVDVFTGGVLAFNGLPADVREHEGWLTLMRRAHANSGTWPGCVSGDAGQGIKAVIEFNTRHGIHSALPWRKDPSGRLARDFECARFDRHGIPRCQVCGGPGHLDGRGLGFAKDDGRGNPIIRFRCLTMWGGEACDQAGVQHINCSENWKMLLPLPRTDSQHHIMRQLHSSGAEGPFHHWRQRYEALGKTYSTRPKRRLSRHAQELRTACAMLVDWLRICLRHGWIGTHNRRNERQPHRCTDAGRAERVREARDLYGLNLPYGPAAVACGARTTDDLPPKTRRRAEIIRGGPRAPDPPPADSADDRPF